MGFYSSIVRSFAVFAFVLAVAAPAAAGETHVLQFVKPIGVAGGGWMSFVSFSPTGSMVASNGPATSQDLSGNLTLWSFPTGSLINQLPVRPSSVSPDWKYFAGNIGIGEIGTGRIVIPPPRGENALYAFSPDSRYVAISPRGEAEAAGQIRVMKLSNQEQLSAFGSREPFALALSPHGEILASGYWDEVVLWNTRTGKRVAVLRGLDRYAQSLSFSRDGRLLAVGSDYGGLQIWDVRRRTKIHSLQIGGIFVSTPAFSPDGKLVAVGIYGTGAVWLIDVASGKVIDHQQVSDHGCGSVAFSPDGRLLITPSTGGLVKWRYDLGGTIRVFRVGATP